VAHGIGLIELDIDTPAESQLLIPEQERGGINQDIAKRSVVLKRFRQVQISRNKPLRLSVPSRRA
jgi:hypothetical protein